MNIENIEAFLYVVHFDSIHKAAEALFLSQPTVSARIKALERELDTELFDRQGKKLVLNENGKKFVPFAEQIMHTFQEGKKHLKKRSADEEITVGANSISSQYFIPFALPLWKKERPELRFKVVSETNDVLVDKLLHKEIDLAFMKDIEHIRLQKHKVLDNSIRLVVYPGHSFQSQSEITAKELALEPMVFFECGSFDWTRVHKVFEVSQVKPRIECQVNDLEVAKSLVLSGTCIGFLPFLSIKKELETGRLIEVDASHLIEVKQSIYVVHINNSSGQPLLWNEICQAVQEFKLGCTHANNPLEE